MLFEVPDEFLTVALEAMRAAPPDLDAAPETEIVGSIENAPWRPCREVQLRHDLSGLIRRQGCCAKTPLIVTGMPVVSSIGIWVQTQLSRLHQPDRIHQQVHVRRIP